MLLKVALQSMYQLSIMAYDQLPLPKPFKLLKWPIICSFMFILFIQFLILSLPYKQAVERIAFNKYRKTTMYKDRLELMGEDYARETYIQYDRPMFIKKITWRDKIKALIIPYSC